MRVGRMGVIAVVVIMTVMMTMSMIMRMRRTFQLERAFVLGAQTLDMVVVAFLRRAHLGFEAQNLLAVLAHRAVHATSPVSICSMRSIKVSITSGWSLR